MKKEKTILLGGLVLILVLSIYVIAWAALDVGNDLNFKGSIGTDGYEIMNLKNPSDDLSAATWGYVKDAVNGEMSNIAIWRQDGTSHDVYLNDDLLPINLSGKVGIGTNDPTANLDILATQLKGLKVQGEDEVSGQGNTYAIYGQAGTGDGNNYAGYFAGADGDGDVVIIGGNVGIGTTNPTRKLDIRGGDLYVEDNLEVDDSIYALSGHASITSSGIYLDSLSQGYRALHASTNEVDLINFYIRDEQGGAIYDLLLGDFDQAVDGAFLQVSQSPAHKGIILQSIDKVEIGDVENWGAGFIFTVEPSKMYAIGGNVGIGTTNPQAKLHVQGDATVTGTLSAGTYEMNNISADIYYDKDDTNYYLDPKGNVMSYSLNIGKPIQMQENTFINRRFEMLENASPQYIILCINGANNDVNGRIQMDRTSGNYQSAIVDVIVSSGTGAMYGGALRTLQVTQSNERYQLVTVTYSGASYVAVKYTGNTYPETSGAYFTGRLVNSGSNTLLVVDSASISDEAPFGGTSKTDFDVNDIRVNNNIVWHAGNDGSTSGLDADLLDTKDLASASTPDTVVLRDGLGDINARLFRSEYDTTNATINYIMTQVDTASNNYIRPSTPTQLKTALGLEAGGSGDIWVEKAGDTMTGDLYLNAKQIYGGFGAETTSGTLDWNHVSNARSGNGYTLLKGDASNGPVSSGNYFHPFGFEYTSKDGTGNMNQLAIPYNGTGLGPYYRTRYSGVWTSWVEFWTSGNDGSTSGLDADLLDGLDSSSYDDQTLSQVLTKGNDAGNQEMVNVRGVHIGGTSDPGTDNLIVDGNVGIGTASPNFLLDVDSGESATSWLGVKSNSSAALQGGLLFHQDSTYGWQAATKNTGNSQNGTLVFDYRKISDGSIQAADVLALKGNGKVGIGTSDPGNFILNIATAGGANPVSIGDDLEVGGGIVTDALDVSGITTLTSLTVSTGAKDNYILTSDSSGAATWQNRARGPRLVKNTSNTHDGHFGDWGSNGYRAMYQWIDDNGCSHSDGWHVCDATELTRYHQYHSAGFDGGGAGNGCWFNRGSVAELGGSFQRTNDCDGWTNKQDYQWGSYWINNKSAQGTCDEWKYVCCCL